MIINILPYKSSWPAEFHEIASRLRQGLGDLALRIDHIGSTSVPGLAAKDIIDIQISVAKLDAKVSSAMLALGYARDENIQQDHRPPNAAGTEVEWEKWFFKPPLGERRSNIHVRVQGRLNQQYALLFRDYLRMHEDTAAAYAELKQKLAQHLDDPDIYSDVKDPAVDLIYFSAQDWASLTSWSPGIPDA